MTEFGNSDWILPLMVLAFGVLPMSAGSWSRDRGRRAVLLATAGSPLAVVALWIVSKRYMYEYMRDTYYLSDGEANAKLALVLALYLVISCFAFAFGRTLRPVVATGFGFAYGILAAVVATFAVMATTGVGGY